MSRSNRSSLGSHSVLAGTALLAVATGMTPARTEAAGTLFWSSSYIRRASTEGDCRQTIQPYVGGEGVEELDVDLELGKLYFTRNLFTIRRCDLDGQNAEVLVTTFSEPLGIDIDAVNRKLYWTEGSGGPAFNRIMRSNLDGSDVELLVSGFPVPNAIAVDPAGGKVYWTQGSFDTMSGAIHRANLDGTDHEQIVVLTGQVPLGIALDHGSSRVYWTDGSGGAIYRANFDGSNAEQILSGVDGIRHLDIDEGAGRLYFGRQVEPVDVFSCDLDGGDFVALGLGAAYGIACVPEKLGFVCFGDANQDLSVNAGDLLSVINSWGPCRSCAADFNGDGVVNAVDLVFVLNHWTS